MPRETITGQDSDGFVVKVGWQADCDVQVGVEDADGRSILWRLYGGTPEEVAEFGAKIRNLASHERLTDGELGREVLNLLDIRSMKYAGLWSTFSRYDVNRLIRTLRRARDSAFGRDE